MNSKLKIGVLTSSRADYGIYKPLLAKLAIDERIELVIIAFGMHLQKQHGNTIEDIVNDNYCLIHRVNGMPTNDSSSDIAKGYGQLVEEFAEYWHLNKYDWVIALGDRFEMSAAVQAGIPLEVKFAHLHGGETTLGAIDNIYRHQISLAAKLHFVASETFAERITEIIGDTRGIYNVGALSLDTVVGLELPDWDDVRLKFDIPSEPFVLVTFHPETVGTQKNIEYSDVVFTTLDALCQSIHVVITLANADAMGSLYRKVANKLKLNYPTKITLVDNFGKENYFAAMSVSDMLLGNTSSGILEAASFGKYVVNVGNRQAGRLRNDNVIDVRFDKEDIMEKVKHVESMSTYLGVNRFYKENTADEIIKVLINA